MSEGDDVTAHTSRPSASNGVPLREFFVLWLERLEEFQAERDRRYEDRVKEADRRYEDRFKAQETAVTAALAAQKELTTAGSAASEKAIAKSDAAQEAYNRRSNEFRDALSDQAKTFLARNEADQRFFANDQRFDEFRRATLQSIANLQIWQGERGGAHAQEGLGRSRNEWVFGAILGGIGTVIGVVGLAAAVLK